jgi:lipid II:glycine glycyltransferase (peptidoglycan interpeptide bridge formation enzyme)
MASIAIVNLQKQLSELIIKIDNLDKKVELISQDLNISRGSKIYIQLEEISKDIKILTKDFSE